MIPKDVKKILKLCRENGVLEYSHNGLTFKLSPDALDIKKTSKKEEKIGTINHTSTSSTPLPEVPWAKLTDEQIATWSAPDETSDPSDSGVI